MTSPLRVGVVGIGRLGTHHARILAALPDVRLVGVADVDLQRAELVAQQHGVRAFSSHRAMIGEVDAVTVAAPTELHEALGIEFLSAGIHTFIEKPLAARVSGGELLVGEARRKNLVLAVGHSERFSPAVKAARRIIVDPSFIEIHRLAPFNPRGTDVDVVLDLMIHDIDLVNHLLGEEPIAVDAVGVAVMTDLVDIANARLRFPSGAVANLTASRVSRESVRKIRFFARDLYVSLDTGRHQVEAVRLVRTPGERPKLEQLDIPVEQTEPLVDELGAFCSAARGVGEPPVSGDEALRALTVAERIRRSIASHAPTAAPRT